MAAFLGALDRLLTGSWEPGRLRVLYVSPLKALNNDIQRNLLGPLAALREAFLEAGLPPQAVGVMVRSGDTPEDERRRLRRQPPEILITTPESLNILLTQRNAGLLFGGLKAVIIDEIHAVVGSKRGTALLTALERLVPLAGEFQRIGLSATVSPPDLVARVLAGFVEGSPRKVDLIASPAAKTYEVKVVVPAIRKEPDDTGKVFWESLALELRKRAADTGSTLIFANSRRACEKLARLMNENPQEDPSAELLAYSHHGSLSKEIRREVEQKLKEGQLRALVATNSLELGIDIGDLDEVILAQTPRTAASAIQKVGRAGHRTGEISRARLYPSHGVDLVEAAVIVRCIREQTVEPIVIPEGPLDVLAQTLLSAWSSRPSTADEMYGLLRGSWPYRDLNRQAFDLVVEMLAGRYAGTRIRELKPRIEIDQSTGIWTAKDAVPFLLYSSGGTIPDRGYFSLRDHRTGSALGELDEEFVWERTLGDRFALGAQVWKIAAIDDQSVRVEPVQAPPHIIPFWKAEDQDRSWFLAEKIGLFLEEADRALEAGTEPWKNGLVEKDGFSPEAADRLVSTLVRERNAVGALPHRWRLVIERVEPDKPGAADRVDADQYVVHTFWGARVNRPWAFALAQAWEDRFGYALETYPGDDQILFLVPPETDLEEALSLVNSANLEDLLRRRLEATGYFGARFREGAGRALLLPKTGFAKRTPLWQTRLRSKRLFEAVSQFPEFPILLEAWRQCLKDEFELEALKQLLEERASGRIKTWHARTSIPSPFTEGLLWRQVNEKMYAGDEPPARRASGLEPGLWDQLLAPDRPLISRTLVEEWESRWGRTAPGYAPESAADLADLLEVRIAISEQEWSALAQACVRDSETGETEWVGQVPVVQEGPRWGVPAVVPLWTEPQPLLVRWLEGRGPVDVEWTGWFWGQNPEQLASWLEREQKAGTIVVGLLTDDAKGPQVCLARTWEQLIRRMRLDRRTGVPTRSAAGLPLALGRLHGLTRPERQPPLEDVVGRLLGLPMAADLWEGAVLPSRIAPYRSSDFDRLFVEGGLRWFGTGPGRVVLAFPEDKAAFVTPPDEETLRTLDQVFDPKGLREISFPDLSARSGMALGPLTETLWSLAWKGAVSATTFGVLRQGLKSGFRFDRGPEQNRGSARAPAGGFQRWSAARTASGTWCRWDTPAPPAGAVGSPLENLEETKRRARLVLDRYGVVFRALLTNESPLFQWKALFPAFRLMELSGEIWGGLFWEGVPGLQFATPEALRGLEAGGDETLPWVQHAQDPTSLCGLGLEVFPRLPRRAAGTWLWWKGEVLVVVLTAGAKKLEFTQGLSDPSPTDWTPWIRRTAALLLTEGKTHWTLETIDGEEAAGHPAASRFAEAGFQSHGDKLIYWKSP